MKPKHAEKILYNWQQVHHVLELFTAHTINEWIMECFTRILFEHIRPECIQTMHTKYCQKQDSPHPSSLNTNTENWFKSNYHNHINANTAIYIPCQCHCLQAFPPTHCPCSAIHSYIRIIILILILILIINIIIINTKNCFLWHCSSLFLFSSCFAP